MKDCTGNKLQQALDFAKEMRNNSLLDCLDRLQMVENNMKQNRNADIDTHIYPDFAPYSFEFVRVEYKNGRDYKPEFLSNGGIIFHGKHDNGGDGSAPTFSVCLTPCNGWQIHT